MQICYEEMPLRSWEIREGNSTFYAQKAQRPGHTIKLDFGCVPSPDHRMGRVGRDHTRSFGLTFLLKQDQPQAQGCVQVGFEYLQ